MTHDPLNANGETVPPAVSPAALISTTVIATVAVVAASFIVLARGFGDAGAFLGVVFTFLGFNVLQVRNQFVMRHQLTQLHECVDDLHSTVPAAVGEQLSDHIAEGVSKALESDRGLHWRGDR